MRMKISLTSLLAAALLTLSALPVCATPLDDRISELKHAVEKEAAARGNAANAQNGFVNPGITPAFIDASIDQVVSQMQNPAYGANMDAQLMQITSMYTSQEVQEAAKNLLNEIKKERKDKDDAEVAAVKDLITRAGKAVTDAKKPEDLDALIDEMANHENNRYGMSPVMQNNRDLAQQYSSAYEFIKLWQNYLAHLTTGQTDQARNDLEMMSNNNNGAGLLPRSKLLALESPDKLVSPAGKSAQAVSTPATQAQAILDGIKTLDDIKAALQKLDPLRRGDMSELQMPYNELSQMLTNYQDLKAGLPASPLPNYGYNQGPVTVPSGLRAQLIVLTLQNEFDSFKGTPPAAGEKPTDFLNRVMADATSREDWDLLRRADIARSSLTQNPALGYFPPVHSSVENIIAAAHQEAAGQFALAVQSYQAALKSDDDAVPAKLIGDKLAAIQRDHPKEYADGMQLTVSPPSPKIYQGQQQGQFPSPGTTNTPTATAPIPSTLLSPAASTNAAPTAK
jgi:hypothetical protein